MGLLLHFDGALCRYVRRGLSSPALRHIQGNVQTTVESGIGIAGKHLFDRA
jgi:hypothetical protein